MFIFNILYRQTASFESSYYRYRVPIFLQTETLPDLIIPKFHCHSWPFYQFFSHLYYRYVLHYYYLVGSVVWIRIVDASGFRKWSSKVLKVIFGFIFSSFFLYRIYTLVHTLPVSFFLYYHLCCLFST